MRKLALVALALWLIPEASRAASIRAVEGKEGEPTFFLIEGELVFGDEKKFIDLALKAQNGGVVGLESPGGNLKAGIEIGKAIRLKGFTTIVPDGALCASACALAWLGGQTRFMGPSAKVGFHSAFRKEQGGPKVSGTGNALVGAYLNTLGLPERAIYFISDAPPEEMSWLSLESAGQHGIEVKRLDFKPQVASRPNPSTPPQTPAVPSSPPAQAPVTPTPGTRLVPSDAKPAQPSVVVPAPSEAEAKPKPKPSLPAPPSAETIRLAEVHLDRARTFLRAGQRDYAFQASSDAIRIAQGYNKAYLVRGIALIANNYPDGALADISKSLRLEPNEPLAHFMRGIAYWRKGDFNRALTNVNILLAIAAEKRDALNDDDRANLGKVRAVRDLLIKGTAYSEEIARSIGL